MGCFTQKQPKWVPNNLRKEILWTIKTAAFGVALSLIFLTNTLLIRRYKFIFNLIIAPLCREKIMVGPLAFLVALFTAHLLADFPLQSDALNRRKRKSKLALAWHAAIHAVAAYVILGVWACWLVPLVIFATHALIDHMRPQLQHAIKWFTSRLTKIQDKNSPGEDHPLCLFTVDQLLHIAVLILLTYRFSTYPWPAMFWLMRFGINTYATTLWLACGLILSVWVGSVVVGIMVRPYHAQSSPEGSGTKGRPGLANAGRTIGRLERFLIFIMVLAGQYAAIGFLITAKSILRFRDIISDGSSNSSDARKEPEYVLIGTLLSLAWVVTVAVAAIHIRPCLMYTRSHGKQPAPALVHLVVRPVGGMQPVIIKH